MNKERYNNVMKELKKIAFQVSQLENMYEIQKEIPVDVTQAIFESLMEAKQMVIYWNYYDGLKERTRLCEGIVREKCEILNPIIKVVDTIKNHYSKRLADDVVYELEFISNEISSSNSEELVAYHESISVIIEDLKLNNYISKHCEYNKIKKLLMLMEEVSKFNFMDKPKDVYILYGMKILLVEFGNELTVLSDLKDENFRRTVLEMIDDSVTFKSIFAF